MAEQTTENQQEDRSWPEQGRERRPRGEEARKERVNAVWAHLGEGNVIEVPVHTRVYYGGMLAYTVERVIKEDGWQVVGLLGENTGMAPRYRSVSTGPGKDVSVLGHGGRLLQRDRDRLAVWVLGVPSVMAIVYALEEDRTLARGFADRIRKLMAGENIYRGGKLAFDGLIRFLVLGNCTWDDVALADELKQLIVTNTVSLLRHSVELARWGIPAKRGLILAGAPGVGKTMISRALMNDSEGITVIEAHPSLIEHPGFIYDLYELARDLRPTALVIEDADLVAYDRESSGYSRGAGLASLLNELDGVEACEQVVTIACTNNVRALDKALTNRPSRFDRVVQIPLPEMAERRYLVERLRRRIPLQEEMADYVASRTEGCTPAQIQDVLFSLVYNRLGEGTPIDGEPFRAAEIDRAIGELYGRRPKQSLGFEGMGHGRRGESEQEDEFGG